MNSPETKLLQDAEGLVAASTEKSLAQKVPAANVKSLKSLPTVYMPPGEEWGVALADHQSGTVVIDYEAYLDQLRLLSRVDGTSVTRLTAWKDTPALKSFMEAVPVPKQNPNGNGAAPPPVSEIRQGLCNELYNIDLLNRFIRTQDPKTLTATPKKGSLRLKLAKWVQAQLVPISFHKYTRVVTIKEFDAIIYKAVYQQKNESDVITPLAIDSLVDYIKVSAQSKSWKDFDSATINLAAQAFAKSSADTDISFDEFATKWWRNHRTALKIQALEKLATSPHLASFIAANF